MSLSEAMSDYVSSRWLMVVRTAALVLGVTGPVFVACDSDEGDDDSAGDPSDCRLIANRCHRYDDESELARECHEVGHDGASPSKCTAMRARCEAECPPVDPDAGTGGSSGSAGATNGGAGAGAPGSGGGATGEVAGAGGSAGEAMGSGGEGTGGDAGSSGTGQGGASNGGTAGSGTAGSGTSNGGSAGGGMSNGGTAGGGGETACETLGRVCHDAGPGRAEECHVLGHDGNEPACEADFVECLAVCTGT